MKTTQSIMALYPNGRGFGFALMTNPKEPIDSRSLEVSSKSKKQYLKRIRNLLEYYKPTLLILENPEVKKKSRRILDILEATTHLAKTLQLDTKYYSRQQIKEVFASFEASTRYEIASCIYGWFPYLGLSLPSPKKIWESEDFDMAAYDALSLALTHYYLT